MELLDVLSQHENIASNIISSLALRGSYLKKGHYYHTGFVRLCLELPAMNQTQRFYNVVQTSANRRRQKWPLLWVAKITFGVQSSTMIFCLLVAVPTFPLYQCICNMCLWLYCCSRLPCVCLFWQFWRQRMLSLFHVVCVTCAAVRDTRGSSGAFAACCFACSLVHFLCRWLSWLPWTICFFSFF